MKNWMDVLGNIVWLTQLGLSMLLPPVVCLWGCYWLVNSCGAPVWLYLPALALGVAAGAEGFWGFYKMMMRAAEKKKAEQTHLHYNQHS